MQKSIEGPPRKATEARPAAGSGVGLRLSEGTKTRWRKTKQNCRIPGRGKTQLGLSRFAEHGVR